MNPLLWDNHTYIAAEVGTPTISQLERHRQAGFSVVFLNLGDANRSFEHIVRMSAFCRQWLRAHEDRFILLKDVADIEVAREQQKLAVGFNVEGMVSLDKRLETLSLYYDLGVRWMLFTYNRRNEVGSGVHDPVDDGLTHFGRQVAREMDRVGMIKCLSHTGYRTAMDVLTQSGKPCIFSHSNVLALKAHARNIPDELIRACAATNGVIGISGLSLFLGGAADAQRLADHIDYVAQLVGIDHVGLGLDYGYLGSQVLTDTATDAHFWPPGNEYELPVDWVAPEQTPSIVQCLEQKGYAGEDLAKILGRNMMRVAAAVWH